MKRAVFFAMLVLGLLVFSGKNMGIASTKAQSFETNRLENFIFQPEGHFGGMVYTTAAAGTHAYIGTGNQILVYNIAEPANPVLASKSPLLDGTVRDLEIAGNYLYAAVGNAGVQILNITNPANPLMVGAYQTDGRVTGIAVEGNHAYTASIFDALRVFDVSDPAHPFECGSYGGYLYIAEGVDAVGSYIYVAAGGSGLDVLHVNTCSNITLAGNYDSTYARDVMVEGDYAYLADGYGSPNFVVVNVSNPAAPTQTGGYAAPGEGYALSLEGAIAYLATWDNGVRFINISNPANPVEVGFYNTPGRAEDVAALGGYLYIADTWDGMKVINANDPSNPAMIYAYASPGEFYDLAVSGSTVFGVDNSQGFYAVDVANPQNPTLLSHKGDILGTMTMDYSLATAGNTTLVTHNGNLEVIDTSNPAHPVHLSTYQTPGIASKVDIHAPYAYVADRENGLLILDISNPNAIQPTGVFDTLGETFDVAVGGNYAYLADGPQGLRVVDVSNPAAPVEVGHFLPGGYARGVVLAGHKVMLSLTFGGMHLVNVSNPTTPTSVGFYDMMLGSEMAATDNLGFVLATQFDTKLQMLDISQFITPTVIAEYEYSAAQINGQMAIQDSWLYAAAGIDGMLVFPLPATIQISEVRPNQTRQGWTQIVDVYGRNFSGEAFVSLEGTALATEFINPTHLQAVVSGTIPAGQYDLSVSAPGMLAGTLPDAFEVLPDTTDTLFAYPDELWVGPKVARQYETTQVGLVVRRVGGITDITNLSVNFYLGDPQSGGILLGTGIIETLAPNSYAVTTGVNWQPMTEGVQTLFAVIGSGLENATDFTVSRQVVVLPAAIDTVAPTITSLTVNGQGDTDVSDPTVSVHITAQDNAGGVGVAAVYLMEFDWNPALGQWVKVGDSGWLDYADSTSIQWGLNWSPGVKNLIAWAADFSGNVSPMGVVRWINFIPPALSINQGQIQMFSYHLSAGQSLSATTTPTLGDPDLYVGNSSGWLDSSLNYGLQTDTVSIVAAQDDLYSVAVYGYETSRYGLSVNVARGGAAVPGDLSIKGSAITPPNAPSGTAPLTQGLPAYIPTYAVYLPLVMR